MQPELRRRSVLGGLAASALVAGQARADEVAFGAYDAFTLYNAEGPFLKDEVILLFHGFASAMPNGAYRGLYAAFSERFSIIGFNYDYFDLDRNDALMESAWTTLLKDRDVTFAGTSLGGFQANYYAERYSVPRAVLVNPIVDPVAQLAQFVGQVRVEKRGLDLTVTEADLMRYADRTAPPAPGPERLVILATGDETLDYRMAEAAYAGPGNTVLVFEGGGHTLDLNDPLYLDPIRTFLS